MKKGESANYAEPKEGRLKRGDKEKGEKER